MWYLILILAGSNSNGVAGVIIPDKYPTEQTCRDAGRYHSNFNYKCIPAPAPVSMCNMSVGNLAFPVPCDPSTSSAPQYDKDGNLKVTPYPGYYCGNNPEKCKLDPNCKGAVESYDNGKIFICR